MTQTTDAAAAGTPAHQPAASAPAWDAIRAVRPDPIAAQVAADDPARVGALVHTVAGLRFDWTKTHLSAEMLRDFGALAQAMDYAGAVGALFRGAVVNVTEGRAAEHLAERGEGAPDSVAAARMLHTRMRALIDAIEAGALGEVRHVLHIGIGGSALGPDLLIDALGRHADRYDTAIVSNVDGAALADVFRRFDPKTTLVAVASKTFTTTETMLNAQSALDWMTAAGVDDPYSRFVALTAYPERAAEWGIDDTRILPFAESVGGRYSLWSSIGFPAALALGWHAFEELLEGAAEMDRHVRLDTQGNVALLTAFADQYYARVRGAQTRAVFAYDERLRLLPSYLQQLEMESNGKSVTRDGRPVDGATAPVTWGGVGTDAQHAVFQLLHQGTHLIPVEFVASRTPGHTLDPAHHEALLANAFAQGAALMTGKKTDDPARSYRGDNPSTTILLPDVTPHALGALLSFYEHRTYANAVLMDINPFDQFGVELGKEMAKAVGDGDSDKLDASTRALMAAAFDDTADADHDDA